MDIFEDVNYMHWSLGFVTAEFFWDLFLILRQRRTVKDNRTPNEDVKRLMDDETYVKSRLYSLEKINFGIFKDAYHEVELLAITLTFFLAKLWKFSGKSIEYLGYTDELIQSNMFLLQTTILSFVVHLPWSLYRTFVIEERHGFNKMTIGFYFKDTFKKMAISQIITGILITPLIWLIKWGGDYFFIYAWGFTFAFTMAIFFVYMDFIAPLFDKYTPVPESPLRTAIVDLAKSINFPLTKLYVVDGSKRSAHSNAFFYGFFKNKRIVLFDTLLDDTCNPMLGLDEDGNKRQFPTEETTEETEEPAGAGKKKGCSQEEVVAVLGHELGHWYHGHVWKPMILNQFLILGMFYSFGLLVKNKQLLADFGFVDEQPTLISLLVIFQFIFSPFNRVMSAVSVYITRCFEFQADRFAVGLGLGEKLQTSLVKLVKDNLSFPMADKLYSTFTFSHPPILERLAAIREEMSKKSKSE